MLTDNPKSSFFDDKWLPVFLIVWLTVLLSSHPRLTFKLLAGLFFSTLLIIYKPEGLLEGYKRRIFILTLILYPPAEFALKLLASLAPLAVNMAEHFTAGLVVSVYLSTLLHGTLRKLGHWERLVFTVSVAVFLCLLYEITGFLIYYEPTAALYSDTMRDLSMNMAGAVMAATLLSNYEVKSGI
ncbi:MAG: hypothetical protein NQU45_00215 [Methanothermobacter sp.]|nr:hypothetical protein [Methanothermobacter sp.]